MPDEEIATLKSLDCEACKINSLSQMDYYTSEGCLDPDIDQIDFYFNESKEGIELSTIINLCNTVYKFLGITPDCNVMMAKAV